MSDRSALLTRIMMKVTGILSETGSCNANVMRCDSIRFDAIDTIYFCFAFVFVYVIQLFKPHVLIIT